jgi:hypothetical protein
MSTKRDRCSRCPETVTHVVRTKGGVHRCCATCAEEVALAIPERVVAVTALAAPAAKPERPASTGGWKTANEMTGNEFAARVAQMLTDAQEAVNQ